MPLHLLVFAIEVAVSTYVCTLEMLSWEGYSAEEQKQLCALYLPYLALGGWKQLFEMRTLISNFSNSDGF